MVVNAVVESPHTLWLAPSTKPCDKKALVAFSKRHGLTNKYIKQHLDGGNNIPYGTGRRAWQRVDACRWLQHSTTGELVVVVGSAPMFISTERAQREDMSFSLRTLQRELAEDGILASGDGQHHWHVLKAGFVPAEIKALEDGSSLSGIVHALPSPARVDVPMYGAGGPLFELHGGTQSFNEISALSASHTVSRMCSVIYCARPTQNCPQISPNPLRSQTPPI